MHLSMISQQELRGYPMSLAVSYAVYKPHYCYLAEAHLHPLPTRLQKEQLPPHKWHSLPSSCSKIPCRHALCSVVYVRDFVIPCQAPSELPYIAPAPQ